MRKCSFTESGEPIILGVLKEATVDETLKQIRDCEAAGATAFNLHLSLLEGESREPSSLKRIFEGSDSPIMAVHYNNNPKGVTRKATSDERMAEVIRAVKCGAAGIDMQGYTFCADSRATLEKYGDPERYPFITASPKEVVLDPEIIERQKEAIREVHSLGGEVLMSCHTGVFLNTKQIVSLAKLMEERSPDFIKIVTPVDNKDDVIIALNSIRALKRELHTRFSYHCSGRVGRITRYIGPYFGSSQVFAMNHYNEYADKEQLLIAKFADFYGEVKSPETKEEWLNILQKDK
ncbi:MAG: type I 3-dehydroquinate dehydratase [Clostridia bacterium]|nr:type I 3-dehydroquinate dehydratase [Clostridia bacterium]